MGNMDISDLVAKKDRLYQTFLQGEADDRIKQKFALLEQAIFDFEHDDCGCGERMKFQIIKSTLEDIERAMRR